MLILCFSEISFNTILAWDTLLFPFFNSIIIWKSGKESIHVRTQTVEFGDVHGNVVHKVERKGKTARKAVSVKRAYEKEVCSCYDSCMLPDIIPRAFHSSILRMLEPSHRLARCFSYRAALRKSPSLSP